MTQEQKRTTERIGSYHLRDVLSDGVMGTVYRAEQPDPVRRTVALKVLKVGRVNEQSRARFEIEMNALARMDHTYIAKVYDAGHTPDGNPFFAMEFVSGEDIVDYCDRRRLGVRDRLRLILDVCTGLQHIHLKGVIHRDIKSTNILVATEDTRPVPKIIDFGLARLGDDAMRTLTSEGQIMGTPYYMSPEQASLGGTEVDTRTDIYSLGVVLYELLAGVLPFPRVSDKAESIDFFRRLRDEDPPRPSVRLTGAAADIAARRGMDVAGLRRVLRRDLDWIVGKAIEKDRRRRYATASELAADLARYLGDEPVLARPPNPRYRLQKFVKRHRTVVVFLVAALLAIAAGSVSSAWWFFRAEAARQERTTLVRLCDQVRDKAGYAHLWFEEALAQDQTIDLDGDVYGPIDEARHLVEAALGDGETAVGSVGKALPSRSRSALRELKNELDEFGRTTRARWEMRNDEGRTGGALDQQYDEIYQRIRKLAATVERQIDEAIEGDWRLSAGTSIAINVLVLVVVACVVILALRKRA